MSTALVLYMPVVHKTYLELIELHRSDTVFLINNDLALTLFEPLRKDLRAVPAADVSLMVNRLYGPRNPLVYVLKTEDVTNLTERFDNFVLPDEDVSHTFAEKFLDGRDVEYRNVFLRYDSKRTTAEFEPNPDEIVTSSEFARRMIAHCDELAQKSPDWWRQIGGLVVKNGQVVDELQMFNKSEPTGMNPYHVGDPRSNFKKGLNAEFTTVLHVEQGLVSTAARLGIALEGADLFVSTFPCPWCAKAVAEAGFKQVFYRDGYAMLDGEEILKVNDIQIIRVVDNV